MRAWITAGLVFFALALSLPIHTEAQTIRIVDSGGGGDFTTIQACESAAVAGDTCSVNAGTYGEAITISKALTFKASTPTNRPVVDCNNARDNAFTASSSIDAVTVDGFEIKDCNDVAIEQLHDDSDNWTIKNNVIHHTVRRGITIEGDSNTIENNIIYMIGNDGESFGVFLNGDNNTVRLNDIFLIGKASIRDKGGNNLIDSNILFASQGGGIDLNDNENSDVFNNYIFYAFQSINPKHTNCTGGQTLVAHNSTYLSMRMSYLINSTVPDTNCVSAKNNIFSGAGESFVRTINEGTGIEIEGNRYHFVDGKPGLVYDGQHGDETTVAGCQSGTPYCDNASEGDPNYISADTGNLQPSSPLTSLTLSTAYTNQLGATGLSPQPGSFSWAPIELSEVSCNKTDCDKAFDRIVGGPGQWDTSLSPDPEVVGDAGSSVVATHAILWNYIDNANTNVNSFQIEGSAGSSGPWTSLINGSQSSGGAGSIHELNNSTAFQFYRLTLDTNHGGGTYTFGELGLMTITALPLGAQYRYVDNAASGANDGTSWADAWQSLASIDWSQINAGDTVYISGGPTSKTYNEVLSVGTATGTSESMITVTKGVDVAHDGTVIIDGQDTRSDGISMVSSGNDYFHIKDLTVQGHTNREIRIENSTGTIIENMTIPDSEATGIRFRFCTDCTARRNNYDTVDNTPNVTDGIFVQESTNTTIENNNIEITNSNTTPHKDCFQHGTGAATGGGTIRNNFCDLNHTDTTNGQGIFGEEMDGTWNVYNNVIKGYDFVKNLISLEGVSGVVLNVYNNVAIGGTSQAVDLLRFEILSGTGTLNVKNNIAYSLSASQQIISLVGGGVWTGGGGPDIDHNIFHCPNNSNCWDGGTWAAWQVSNDANGFNSDPMVDVDGRPPTESPAIDAGVAIGLFSTDKEGVTRPMGAGWDIGAYESDAYFGPAVADIGTDGTVLSTTDAWQTTLEGASSGTYRLNAGTYTLSGTLNIAGITLAPNNGADVTMVGHISIEGSNTKIEGLKINADGTSRCLEVVRNNETTPWTNIVVKANEIFGGDSESCVRVEGNVMGMVIEDNHIDGGGGPNGPSGHVVHIIGGCDSTGDDITTPFAYTCRPVNTLIRHNKITKDITNHPSWEGSGDWGGNTEDGIQLGGVGDTTIERNMFEKIDDDSQEYVDIKTPFPGATVTFKENYFRGLGMTHRNACMIIHGDWNPGQVRMEDNLFDRCAQNFDQTTLRAGGINPFDAINLILDGNIFHCQSPGSDLAFGDIISFSALDNTIDECDITGATISGGTNAFDVWTGTHPNGANNPLTIAMANGDFSLFHGAIASNPGTFYVTKSGSDGNSCDDIKMIGTPALTLNYAYGCATADGTLSGDGIRMGTGTYNETLTISHSGTSGGRFSLAPINGQSPILDGTGVNSPVNRSLLWVTGSHIKINGFTIQNEDNEDCIEFSGDNTEIEGMTFDSCASEAVLFESPPTSPSTGRILNNAISNMADSGIRCRNVFSGFLHIENNTITTTITNGGSQGAIHGQDCAYAVIKGNTITDTAGPASSIFWTSTQDPSLSHHVVIEDNIIRRGSVGGHSSGIRLDQFNTRSIVRRNQLQQVGIIVEGPVSTPDTTVKIYNNTVVDAGLGLIGSGTHAIELNNNNGNYQGITLKNNALINSEGALVSYGTTPLNGNWPDVMMDGNAYHMVPSGGVEWWAAAGQSIYATTFTSFNNWRATHGQEPSGGVFISVSQSQIFVNAPSFDYTPATGSPLINAGRLNLTTAATSGSGTSVPVADSSYFSNGYGLVAGDQIKIGSNAPVTVLDVIDGTDTLVISASVVWTSGDSVALAFDGNAPDIGAIETTSMVSTASGKRLGGLSIGGVLR